MEALLLQLFIFFAAAAIAVPIAKKLGLGSVLGYLIAGIVIGPFGLSLIGNVDEVMHMTEFGVVMMLFLVGLELKPSMLWQMRTPIVGMGGLQVVLSALAISGIGFVFLPWQQALSVGLILSLSSTAIVLQTLQEKGLNDTISGRSIFAVLLFQDLAVIPMLAFMPLLTTIALQDDGHGEEALFDIGHYPGGIQFLMIMTAIILIIVAGRYATRPIFRAIAATNVREIFVASALALVVGIAVLMSAVGLSQALGTFLAGVVLADSEYRHELESDLAPFKGLLLGIFFISIGASFDFVLIGQKITLILGLTAGLILVKFIVLLIVGGGFKMGPKDRSLFAVSLAQGGEFAFVLFSFAQTNGVLPGQVVEPLISAVAISMFLTPLLFNLYEKVTVAKQTEDHEAKGADHIETSGHKVIMAGFGRFGTDIGRFLISAGIKPVIIDSDAANVEVLRRFGFEVYYGDVTRLDLLEAAGANEAELLLITMSEIDVNRQLIEMVQKHFPNLKLAVNAADRETVYHLLDMGVTHNQRETIGSALLLGQDVLVQLGVDPYEAYRQMRLFKNKEEAMLHELYQKYLEERENDDKNFDAYISMYQQHMTELEELMILDLEEEKITIDRAWTAKNPES